MEPVNGNSYVICDQPPLRFAVLQFPLPRGQHKLGLINNIEYGGDDVISKSYNKRASLDSWPGKHWSFAIKTT